VQIQSLPDYPYPTPQGRNASAVRSQEACIPPAFYQYLPNYFPLSW